MEQSDRVTVGEGHRQRGARGGPLQTIQRPATRPLTDQTRTETPREVRPLHPDAGPVLLCLLGPFQALGCGAPLPVRGGKVEALLRTLALRHSEMVSRDELLAQLWADREHALAAQSLNSLVYGVQRLLRAPLAGAPAILHEDGAYRLNRAAGVDVDTLRFDACITAGQRLLRADDLNGAHAAFASATGLYRGDLRVGSGVAEIIERERLRASYLAALAHLADYSFARGEYADSLEYALRILAADPCREDAHRLVMRCRVRRGERAQALRQFRLCEAVLRAEFDAPPEPATRAVYDQIRLNPAGV